MAKNWRNSALLIRPGITYATVYQMQYLYHLLQFRVRFFKNEFYLEFYYDVRISNLEFVLYLGLNSHLQNMDVITVIFENKYGPGHRVDLILILFPKIMFY